MIQSGRNATKIIVYPLSHYDLPSGSIDRLRVRIFSDKPGGTLERKWNMERVLYFMSMTLQVSLDIKGATKSRHILK